MTEKIFNNKWDNLVAKELANKVISIVLAISLCVTSFVIFKLATEQKTIILPPKIEKEIWATSSTVSQSYLEQIGFFISVALTNVSPNNVDEQFELILDLASPKFYQTLKSELSNQSRYIKANDITSLFLPEKKRFNYNSDHILVRGGLKHIIADKVVKTETLNLKIFFEIQNGRFYITNLEKTK